jgi:hypothetical protein
VIPCLTLERLFAQPDNEGVLRHVLQNAKSLRPEEVRSFEAGTDGSPFDEGGQIFFHRYGRLLPRSAHCSLESCNILVHEETARIFALHEGRFTIALRLDKAGWDDVCHRLDVFRDSLRSETLDGHVDLRLLGPGWWLFSCDGDEDAQEVFLKAYEQAGR